jgi:hypothetical protein
MARRSWRRAGSILAWLALVITCALPVAGGAVAPLGRASAVSASAASAVSEPVQVDRAVGAVPAVLDRVGGVGHIAQAVHRWDDGSTRGRPALGPLAGVAVLAALLVRPSASAVRRAPASHVPTASRGRAPPRAVLPG